MHSLTMYRGRFAPWSAIEAMNFLWPDRTVRRLELPLNQGYPYDMLSQRDCKAPTHTHRSDRARERERGIGWGTFLKRACSCAYCIYIYIHVYISIPSTPENLGVRLVDNASGASPGGQMGQAAVHCTVPRGGDNVVTWKYQVLQACRSVGDPEKTSLIILLSCSLQDCVPFCTWINLDQEFPQHV